MALPWTETLKLCSQAISEYGFRGQWRESTSVLAVAREEGIALDLPLYRKAINACRENRQWRSCSEILRSLRHLEGQGVRADSVLYGASMASASGLMPATMPWNLMQAAKWDRALEVLQGLRQDGTRADVAFWRTASSACGQGNRWEAASLLLSEMRWAALPVEVESYAGAMLAALNTDWPAVLALFRDLRRRPRVSMNTVILNTGMLAADSAGRPDRAYRLLRAMQEVNVEADVVSITMGMTSADAMTSGSGKNGWTLATRIFSDALEAALEPNRVAFTALIDLQERAGRWELAQLAIEHSRAARVEYDSAAYRTAMRVAIGSEFVWDAWHNHIVANDITKSRYVGDILYISISYIACLI